MLLGIRWGGLRAKIVVWSFLPTAFILAAVALVTFMAYEQVTEELVLGKDRELVYLSATQLKEKLDSYSDVLENLARTRMIYEDNLENRRTALVLAKNRLVYFDAGVVLLDKFGTVVATEPERPEIMGQVWSSRSYYRQLLYSSRPKFSDIISDGPGGAEVIVVAVPVIGEQDEFTGVLAGMFYLGPFYGSLAQLRIDQIGLFYLVDGNGRVIYHPKFEYIGNDISSRADVQHVLSGNIGAKRIRNLEGKEIVAAYAPIQGTSWRLVLEDDWHILSRSSKQYARFLLFLLISGMIVPAMVVGVGVRRITRPIQELISAAKQVAEGNFGLTINANTGDEVQELADQFNLMSAELKESYITLEQKVTERTRALAALYDVTAAASTSLDLQTVLERSLDRVLRVMVGEVGAIHLLDDSKELLIHAASRGFPEEAVVRMESVSVHNGLLGWTIEKGEPLVVPDLGKGPRPLLAFPAAEDQTYVGVPMRAKGKPLGVLSILGEPGRVFSLDEVTLLDSIADEIALAVDNARLYQQAERLAVMEERSRLARELHDSVTQLLYSLTLFAEAGQRMIRIGDIKRGEDYLDQLGDTAQQALKEMRLLIYELRPPEVEEEGLIGALQRRLDAVEKRVGLEVCLFVDKDINLPASVEDYFFRIAVEALNNALKHAYATAVKVQIRNEGQQVTLVVEDNGKGFEPAMVDDFGGMGLITMRERIESLGGSFEVNSVSGEGTRVIARLEKNFEKWRQI